MGAPRAPSVRLSFQDARVTPALFKFLEGTRVGLMPGQILLAGGEVEDESDLEAIELWPQEEEEEAGSSEESEESGPGPPL